MHMPLRRLRRLLALFALALVVCAALPCSLLAAEDSCCGSAAGCGDASESPCAQLATTPCCESSGAPLEFSVTVRIPESAFSCQHNIDLWPSAAREAEAFAANYTPPALRIAEILQRTEILRL